MPRVRLTKGAIDSLPTLNTDVVYWDTGLPGFGVKVTPKGRKVAQKVFAARLEGRDPAAEKREARRFAVLLGCWRRQLLIYFVKS